MSTSPPSARPTPAHHSSKSLVFRRTPAARTGAPHSRAKLLKVRELQQLQRSTSSSPSTASTGANKSGIMAGTVITTTTTTTGGTTITTTTTTTTTTTPKGEEEAPVPRSLLYSRMKSIADEFVAPGCPTEVNVKGESRTAALDAIASAMAAMDTEVDSDSACRRKASKRGDAEGRGEVRTDRAAQESAESTMAAAIDALGELSGEVITVVIHDIWPRFRSSPEFEQLMETEVCSEGWGKGEQGCMLERQVEIAVGSGVT